MKKLFLFTLMLAIFAACQSPDDEIVEEELQLKSGHKVEVCHYDAENDTWVAISVAEVAWQKAHMDHGDVLIIDADGDGYYAPNNCGIMGDYDVFDCNDDDYYINPGMEEICGNDIDENCDGVVGEWNLIGEYELTLDFSTPDVTTIHIMDIVDNTFTGTGYYTTDEQYTWDVEGTIDGSYIEMKIVYTGENAGYWLEFSGEIAQDGTISGVMSNDSQVGTWMTTSGAATCN